MKYEIDFLPVGEGSKGPSNKRVHAARVYGLLQSRDLDLALPRWRASEPKAAYSRDVP